MTAPHRALKLWGLQIQLRKLAEECAELAVAALHVIEDRTADREDSLCEEIADVEIMIEGMRSHYGDVAIDRHRAKKLARLEKRMADAQGKAVKVQPAAPAAKPEPPAPKVSRKSKVPAPEGLPDGYLTVAAAALAAGCTIGSLRTAIADNRLAASRVGCHVYVSRDDAIAYALKARGSTRRRGSAA